MGVGLGAGAMMCQQMAGVRTGAAAAPGTAQPAQQVAPPPLPGGAQYYVAINNQQAGPVTMDALKQHLAAGSVQRDTLVWKQGMASWTAAASVPDLQQLFTTVPPPLPPK